MSSRSRRAKFVLPVGAALTAAGLVLGFGASAAGAQAVASSAGKTAPGDNGDVKVHRSTTPVSDPSNQPHVCVFYLDAFNFDPGQAVSWTIKSWPPTGNRSVVDAGTITLDNSGIGFTSDQSLPNGHYKLFWNFAGEHGFAKQKVFWVSCPAPTPTPTPTPTSPSPRSTSPGPTPSPVSTSASVSPTPTPTVPPAPAPTPVHTTLPVTG